MAEERLQKELRDVLSSYDLDALIEDSSQIGSLMEVIMNENPANGMYKTMRVLQKGADPKEIEAVLRLSNSQLWIIVSTEMPANMITLSSFNDMATSVYVRDGSYRRNFDRISIENAAGMLI